MCYFALRRDLLWPDDLLAKSAACAAIAALALSVFALIFTLPAAEFAAGIGHLENEIELILLALGGGLVYTLVLGLGFFVFGVRLRRVPGRT